MATQLSEAWSSLQSGQVRDAREAFRDAVRSESNATAGYLGLAAAALGTGNLRDALSFGQRSLQESHTPEAHLLLGEVHSRLGNRRDAEDHLTDYFSSGGESAYARAVLGEQRIRTARWDQGIEDYLSALNRDVDGRAFRQLKGVLADLTEVVANGRLPPEPAEDFLDRLEANLQQPPPNADRFFNSVRRALSTKSTISDPGEEEAILELVGPAQLPEGAPSTSPPGSAGAPGPPSSSTSSPPTNSGSEPSADADDEEGIDPKQKDLAGVIQQDRAENEKLQEQIGSMPPPDWPSDPAYGTIDPLPRMDYEDQSIFVGDPDMDATDFRITSGNVRAEIFLERCLQNLLAGASEDRAIAIRYRPETITQIEVNCWDGLLDRLPEMSPIYADFHESGDYGLLALGRFIGECVATPYDGTWDFADPPDESKLIIGNQTLDPFGFVKRWKRASDPDAVSLEQLGYQAARASRKSNSMTVEQDYIDPTRELEGQSLGVKLAELWAGYLFRLADASFADLAETLEPLVIEEEIIVFSIEPDYCPDNAIGPQGAALLEGGNVPLAYVRDTGEFLLMASRKHAARAVAARFGDISSDTGPEIATFLANYHRPRWQFASNDSKAADLSSRTGVQLQGPELSIAGDERSLQLDCVSSSGPVRMTITDPGSTETPWQLTVEAIS